MHVNIRRTKRVRTKLITCTSIAIAQKPVSFIPSLDLVVPVKYPYYYIGRPAVVLYYTTMPLPRASPQRQSQQGNMPTPKKTATRDRLPAQVFTRGTTGAVTVKTQRSEGTSVTNVSMEERSRSSRSQTREPRDRSPRPPRTRRRSSSARRTNDERVVIGHRSVRSGDSSSDLSSAASPSGQSRGRRASSQNMEPRDSPSIQKPSVQKPSIQKPSPQKPGSRDSSPAPSIDSQKLHVKITKKVIDGTFQSH
jgi:hypothetical protein